MAVMAPMASEVGANNFWNVVSSGFFDLAAISKNCLCLLVASATNSACLVTVASPMALADSTKGVMNWSIRAWYSWTEGEEPPSEEPEEDPPEGAEAEAPLAILASIFSSLDKTVLSWPDRAEMATEWLAHHSAMLQSTGIYYC